MKSRPLLAPALAFAAGSVFADAFPHPALLPGCAGAALAFAAAAVLGHARGAPRAAQAALWAVCLLAGTARLAHARRPAADDVAAWGEGEGVAALEGVIDGEPEPFPASGAADGAPPGSWFVLDVERARVGGAWRKASGRVRVTVGDGLPAAGGGDRVRLSGWFESPRGRRNPGGFDFGAHLARHGIRRTLRAARATDVERLGRGPLLATLRGAAVRRLSRAFDAIGPEGGLYRALLLGDRSALTPGLEDAFVRSGTAHVLAVSGLNLVLVVALAAGAARLAGARPRLAGALAIGTALAYAALVGWSPPVTRATAMAAALVAARAWWRRADAVNSLAAAALLVLAVNPEDLFGAGFQLSFAAVLALVLGTRPIEEALGALNLAGPGTFTRLRRESARLVAASLAAGLATAPLVLAHFHIVCPVSVAANLLVVPAATALLVFGGAAAGLGAISPALVEALAPAFAWPAAAGRYVVEALGSVPGGHAWLPAPPVWATVAMLALLLLSLSRPRTSLALASVLAAALSFHFAAPAPPAFRATFLDVGQGSCTALEFPDGDLWIVDCGASGTADPGARVAAPYAWSRRRVSIDALVLTHADVDHISGAAGLIERLKVKRLVVSAPFLTDPRAGPVLAAAASIPVVVVAAGDTLRTRSGTVVRVLGPPAATPGWSANDTSVVLLAESEGLSVLLTGDIQSQAVKALLTHDLRADILQVPHHGGTSSRSLELGHAVSPALGVVSAREWFPSPDVEADYRALGIPWIGTWERGAVRVEGRGGRWRVESAGGK
jgi:competence protein ComEC